LSAPALPVRGAARVVSNAALGGECFRLVLRAPGWPGSRPGQFAMLSPGALGAAPRFDPLLPRPMAVYRERLSAGEAEVEILYRVEGRGTALLAEAGPGARVGLVGPLGRSFPLPEAGAGAVLVGGGTGIASLYALAVRAAERGPVTVLLGARSASDLMGREDFAATGADLRVATDDGSAGTPGFVTELLPEALADGQGPVYACGPRPMMRLAAEAAASRGRACFVSLENTMACGFGVCLGCAVPRADAPGFALVCRDGPVLPAAAVDWEGLS